MNLFTELYGRDRTVMALNNSFMWVGTTVGSGALSLIIAKYSFYGAAWVCSAAVLIAGIILKLVIKEPSRVEVGPLV